MELHACYFKDLGAFSTDQRRASATAGNWNLGDWSAQLAYSSRSAARDGRPKLHACNLSRRSRSYGHSMGVNTPARKSALAAHTAPTCASCDGPGPPGKDQEGLKGSRMRADGLIDIGRMAERRGCGRSARGRHRGGKSGGGARPRDLGGPGRGDLRREGRGDTAALRDGDLRGPDRRGPD